MFRVEFRDSDQTYPQIYHRYMWSRKGHWSLFTHSQLQQQLKILKVNKHNKEDKCH